MFWVIWVSNNRLHKRGVFKDYETCLRDIRELHDNGDFNFWNDRAYIWHTTNDPIRPDVFEVMKMSD